MKIIFSNIFPRDITKPITAGIWCSEYCFSAISHFTPPSPKCISTASSIKMNNESKINMKTFYFEVFQSCLYDDTDYCVLISPILSSLIILKLTSLLIGDILNPLWNCSFLIGVLAPLVTFPVLKWLVIPLLSLNHVSGKV